MTSTSSHTPPLPTVTAVVCTHDRPALLRRALSSLLSQRLPATEILVVDNAPSSDATRNLVHGEFPAVRYEHEPVPGLDFARNRALHAATSDVVAFLDDDAAADAGWVEALAHVMRDPHVGMCTGRVEALATDTEAQRLFEENGGFSRGMERRRLPAQAGLALATWRAAGRGASSGATSRAARLLPVPLIACAFDVGAGCSMAVRRTVAVALGGFDEALDLGDALPGGGDHDMLWRMLEAGHEVVYEPAALAWHEHRREMEGVAAQIAGQQRAMVALLTKCLVTARGRRRASVAAYLGWRLVKPGARLIRRAAGRDPLPAWLLARTWRACWRGILEYPRARRIAMERTTRAWNQTASQ
ncbi:MAG TPA: glycosyltransferase [Gemmatimonadaceae bacterium]|nr:glycosyltransferase [Gemmatimonadaceae bacterium]